MAVVKARGCKHEFDTREFTVGQGGIALLPLDKSSEMPVLPIESYSSVLSRAPARVARAADNSRRPKRKIGSGSVSRFVFNRLARSILSRLADGY